MKPIGKEESSGNMGTVEGKIQIKGALGHLGPAGDILYAGFCGTSLQKQIIGCLQPVSYTHLLWFMPGSPP